MSCQACKGFGGVSYYSHTPSTGLPGKYNYRSFAGIIPDFLTGVWGVLGGVNSWYNAMVHGSDKPPSCGILSKPVATFGKWQCKTDWGLIAIGAIGFFLLAGKIKVR